MPSTRSIRRPGAGRAGRSRGQVVVIFALSIFLFVSLCAVVVDIAWYWVNTLRVQRAADAAALAGVIQLPGNPSLADSLAISEAQKDGYTNGSGGVVVSPSQDAHNNRRLNVTVTAPVSTFFMRVVGISSITASRNASAEYVLPVPMGSPQNYYGVGYYIKPVTTVSHPSYTDDSGLQIPAGDDSHGNWSATTGTLDASIQINDNRYAQTRTNNDPVVWNGFGLATPSGSSPIPAPTADKTVNIDGIVVTLSDTFVSSFCSSSKMQVELSWDGGVSWTTPISTPNLGTSTSTDYPIPTSGGSTSTSAWGPHTWVRNDFLDANFRVRLTSIKGCGSSTIYLETDQLQVRVYFSGTTTSTSYSLSQVNIQSPTGAVLNPQKFWGAMQSQGAPNIQGDIYMTKYNPRTSGLNASYDPSNYYSYIVEVPTGASNASVWIFDPGFCDVTTAAGTGENWTVGGTNGYSSREPVSSYFDLLTDPYNTPYDVTDDVVIASTNNAFRRVSYEDYAAWNAQGSNPTSGIDDCSEQDWHNIDGPTHGWYQLASGLGPGKYRLHTYSTDPTSPNDQNNTTALNAFAFYATATGGTPRIYGFGAMEAYVRLPGGQASEFYLAQIDAVHAGKTMVISLWDPGDTGNLSASLQILQPGTLAPATFSYQGASGASGSTSGCSSRSGTNVTAVTTNTGGSSLFNGCWLTLEIQIPSNYTAPADPATGEHGWWKIRYTMGGSTSQYSTDLTTWKVDIRGNPVHLVLP